jgi:pSer/pThr/pTyr-binding forkhead associated (FHA) protein
MNLTDYLEKWGRTLFEGPLAIASREGEPPELAEIRLALFEQARSKSYRAGGRRVFPYDRVRLFLLGIEKSRAAAFHGKFFCHYLEEELKTALGKSDCRYPETLRVEVDTSHALPGPGEPWLRVETFAVDPAAESAAPAARLVVLEGSANATSIPIDRENVYIGRAPDVYSSEGMRRRNDLVFGGDSEINRSVSREHAHITWDQATGEYRLHNDRWYALGGPGPSNPGTWIVRKGVSQPVHRGTRGTKLEHGDELRFGRAAVRFEVG